MQQKIKRLFGTDGIRGIANNYPMTPELTTKLGKALTYTLQKEKSDRSRLKIVIGKDTRLSGYMFEQALAAGIGSMGADVLLVGPLPTPAIAFITSSMRADAGVVISASHNPYNDNGIKIFDNEGFKLPDAKEIEIEEIIASDTTDEFGAEPEDIGKAYRVEDAQGRYVVFAKNSFSREMTLDGFRIVLDCANGAAYRVAPTVFSELGAEVVAIGTTPDGKNINQDCGSLNPELMKQRVLAEKADLGIALDGDADRVIFCDENGNEVDGDKIIAICAEEMIATATLRGPVVTTEMSNVALENFIAKKGVEFVRTSVGDRYVVEEMRKRGSNLGGEKSGHIIFLDHTTTGDGTLAALQVLAIMKKKDKKLSELAQIIDLYPQILLNVNVKEKRDFGNIGGLSDLLVSSEHKLEGNGRINLRYSGTEPISRVMVEGENDDLITEIAEDIAGLIQREIGA